MKHIRFNKSIITMAISTALLSTSSSVIAAETNAAEEKVNKGSLEVIQVTATRRSKAVEEIPFNISAISGDAIEEANIIDAQELLREMPGVTVPDNGARLAENNNGIMIRGLNVNPAATDRAFLSDPTVSTYVGDTPVFANFILKDIERVEVMRGPQGTLYGSGSLGGTVRYILNKPDLSGIAAKADFSYGSTDGSDGNNMSFNGMFNLPVSDSIALRFNVGKIDNDGVIDYTNVYATDSNNIPLAQDGDEVYGEPIYQNVKDADTVEMSYARASALYKPNDDFQMVLTYMNQEGEYGGRRQETSGPDGWGEYYDDLEIGAVLLEPAENESEFASLEIEYDLGFATLSSSTSMYDRDYVGTSDNTGFFAANGWLLFYGYGNFPRPAYAAERQNHEEAVVQEFRLASNGDNKNYDWIIGAYYMDQESSAAQQTELRGFTEWRMAADGVNPNYLGDFYDLSTNSSFDWTHEKTFTDKALFGEFTYHMSDALDLTVGARHFRNEQNVTSQTAFPIWFAFNPVIDADQDDSGTLLKANISYQLNDDQMIYGTVSEGYRRGGTNAAPVRPDEAYPNDPEWNEFAKDTVVNYEFGLKGFENDLRYTVSLFYVDWQDPQLNVATPSGAYYAVANGDSAATKGLETEFSWAATQDITVSGGYTYVNAKLTSDLFLHDASPETEGKTALRANNGAQLPGTAEHTFNFSITHAKDISADMYLVSRIGAYYQSEVENSILDIDENWAQTLDGFSLVSASVALIMEDWTISLYAKNITNEKGTVATYKEEYMTSDPANGFYGTGQKDFITTPRTITLSASYNF
jgi:outer membrane receptor protein involved in Fe transport